MDGPLAPPSGPTRETCLRFAVAGGTCAAVPVQAGDVVTVVDRDGGQPGQLFVVSEAPREAAGELAALHAALERFDHGGAATDAVAEFMRRAGGSVRVAARTLFGADGGFGASVVLTAAAPELWIFVAPGRPMAADAQDPPTDLDIVLQPLVPGLHLPPRLARPGEDIRIRAATAGAYRVGAGDYIQIIDVEGRQCADFLAFDALSLSEGVEHGLDPTATRTVMGTASPGPGLHSKFYDARLRPLVEVIQDTVGRHDSFMMACNAKYYAEAGYPGHDNCTDNFNRTLAPHGVAPRAGWPAINFFYNTQLAADGAITMDEPWSRPGDYVLLRALTDLVCATSSCADDIDPANGWRPTDIHVRIYDKSSDFPRGIVRRMTADASPVLSRESGFAPRVAALTRRRVDYRGYWLPTAFGDGGAVAEYWACREAAAVMDLSALRKFEVVGPDAEALMQLAVTRDVRKLATGQVVYTAMCYEHGGMIDDGTIFRLGPNNFRWICGDDYCGVWLRELGRARGLAATVRSSTSQLHNIAVQGPKSREILAELVVTPAHQPLLAELKWFRFTIGRIGGADGPAVVVSRTGYTGELGYEIWCHPTDAVAVWDAVWEAGLPRGLAPLGLEALDMLRIEAGLVFAGFDFDDQTDPFEAGIGFTVPAAKPDDYVGRAALAQRGAHPRTRLVGLDVDGNEAVGHGDPIYRGRARIGVVTSATRSPLLRRTIALARLDVSAGAPGTAVEIGKLDGHIKRIGAAVAPFPAYDPTKTRVRS